MRVYKVANIKKYTVTKLKQKPLLKLNRVYKGWCMCKCLGLSQILLVLVKKITFTNRSKKKINHFCPMKMTGFLAPLDMTWFSGVLV